MANGIAGTGARGMTERNKDVLIDAMMYVATPELRQYLMAECPVAYNDYCGSEVVKVVRNCDGATVRSPGK